MTKVELSAKIVKLKSRVIKKRIFFSFKNQKNKLQKIKSIKYIKLILKKIISVNILL